jgi:hypothetical protein
VVGHHVEDHLDPLRVRRVDQPAHLGEITEALLHAVVVDGVVTVVRGRRPAVGDLDVSSWLVLS